MEGSPGDEMLLVGVAERNPGPKCSATPWTTSDPSAPNTSPPSPPTPATSSASASTPWRTACRGGS